jgi:hypothetical protein
MEYATLSAVVSCCLWVISPFVVLFSYLLHHHLQRSARSFGLQLQNLQYITFRHVNTQSVDRSVVCPRSSSCLIIIFKHSAVEGASRALSVNFSVRHSNITLYTVLFTT